MREDVEFTSKGVTCRGWLYRPDGAAPDAALPAVVMAHGFSGVRELDLPRFAEAFVAAGLAVLVFDFRFLGASDGEPRQQVLPNEQREDYRNAITWLRRRPGIDPERIGLWGTSYSGGHVLHLGAFDRRVKAVVSQVPNVGAFRSALAQGAPEALHLMSSLLTADREGRYPGEDVHTLPVVGPPGSPAVLGTPDAYEFFQQGIAEDTTWVNEVSIESVEQLLSDDPACAMELIAPTPLLMVVAAQDSLIPVDVARAVFERAGEPKRLLELDCGHFDVYSTEPYHSEVLTAETDWFVTHLG